MRPQDALDFEIELRCLVPVLLPGWQVGAPRSQLGE